jgi:hypothetical protein
MLGMMDILTGFDKVKMNKIEKLKPGDLIKYRVDKVLKHGGLLSKNMYPNYLVLVNYAKHVTWCVQLSNPTLILYVKSKERLALDRAEKNNLWKAHTATLT